LEYVLGEIYANVWQTDLIARIDPGTGAVTSWIDLTGLLASGGYTRTQTVDVLNGIAYDVQNDRLFVTGKLWPHLFEIELIPPHQIFLPWVIGTPATAAQGRSNW
jgi:glutaminyl-peptide cyclotransferase